MLYRDECKNCEDEQWYQDEEGAKERIAVIKFDCLEQVNLDETEDRPYIVFRVHTRQGNHNCLKLVLEKDRRQNGLNTVYLEKKGRVQSSA